MQIHSIAANVARISRGTRSLACLYIWCYIFVGCTLRPPSRRSQILKHDPPRNMKMTKLLRFRGCLSTYRYRNIERPRRPNFFDFRYRYDESMRYIERFGTISNTPVFRDRMRFAFRVCEHASCFSLPRRLAGFFVSSLSTTFARRNKLPTYCGGPVSDPAGGDPYRSFR